ncbi:hypothetical protein ACFL5O_11825 [Myxococcota bacterium]
MGNTAKAWMTFVGLVIIPVVAIGAHIGRPSRSTGPESERAASEALSVAVESTGGALVQHAQGAARPSIAENVPWAQNEEADPAPGAEPEAEPKADARPRRTETDIEADLESAFQAAGPGGTTEAVIDRKLRAMFDASQIDSLECRAARCRMELSFSDAGSAERKLREVFLAPDYDLGVGGTITGREERKDGSMSVRVHLYREGDNDVTPEPGYE